MSVIAIQRKVDQSDLDAVLLSRLQDIRWATGFTGSNALLLVTPDAAHFITDTRYATQAAAQVKYADVHVPGYALVQHVKDADLLAGCTRVGFQSDTVTASGYTRLQQLIGGVEWVPLDGWLNTAVARKTEAQVAHIRAAQAITERVFDDVVALMRPGMTEREVAAEIIYRHLTYGAEGQAFEPIVASGPNGALPHARPTDRQLESGDLVVLDFGCVVHGYASDMTRTVALGEPSAHAREVYGIVREAQQAALAVAKPGLPSKALDAVARDVIEAAGYGEAFGHSLGHGVGLDVHEWPPVSFRSEEPLPTDCVVTIEPGIYLRGQFGVRIEDMVWLREAGTENLTHASTALLTLPV